MGRTSICQTSNAAVPFDGKALEPSSRQVDGGGGLEMDTRSSRIVEYRDIRIPMALGYRSSPSMGAHQLFPLCTN